MNNNTLFFGQNRIKLDSCPSTNNYLKDLLANTKPMPEGTVIMAVDQTQGRGQSGNTWISEPGKNLSLSYLLYPHFVDLQRQFELNLAISLGVMDTFKEYLGEKVKVKWPNDVYYVDKKLAGILIENSAIGSQIRQSIIGIGMNINQTSFPENLPQATSIFQIIRREIDLEEVFQKLSQNLEHRYLQLRNKQSKELRAEYENNLLGKLENRKFLFKDKIVNGIIQGVNEHGMLRIVIDREELKIDFKEIQFLFNR